MTDVRNDIVDNGHWGVANHAHFTYSMGPERMEAIGKPRVLPIIADCSSWVTCCYNWAGAPDPNGQNYDHEGYTGTLLSHGQHITVSQVIPGDVVIYGAGEGDHAALIVEVHGQDILTVSHGQQGDPSYVWVNPPKTLPSRGYSSDGRKPQTFLRFNTTKVVPKPVPKPTPKPTPAPKPTPKPVPKPTPKPVVPKPAPKKK